MFEIKGKTHLLKTTLRTEMNEKELVRALSIDIGVEDVPMEKISSALSDPSAYWDEELQLPKLQETYPIKIAHRISNVAVTFNYVGKPVALNGADIGRISITPTIDNNCNFRCTILAADYPDGVLDKLSHWSKRIVEGVIVERQMSLVDAG